MMIQAQGALVQYIFLEIVSIYVCIYSTLSKKKGEIYGKNWQLWLPELYCRKYIAIF